MKIAFIGYGNVGYALASNLSKKGHDIVIAYDDEYRPRVSKILLENPTFSVSPVQHAIDISEITILATPFKFNEEILTPIDFKGKVLVDCTNPVGRGITHGLESKISGAEKVQQWSKNAKVVKSYSIYGYENLENSRFPDYDIKPVMMIAGNDVDAKEVVRQLNNDLGFETLDVGDLSQSLHLEHMTLLWVNMVRANGHHPNFTWAYLER